MTIIIPLTCNELQLVWHIPIFKRSVLDWDKEALMHFLLTRMDSA